MIIKKYIILKGLSIGALTGLLTTFIESIFLLSFDVYIPVSFPFVLIIFNILFWMFFGLISAIFINIYIHKKPIRKNSLNYLWTLFYLLPFTVVYTTLGFLSFNKPYLSPAFDKHLSVLWVSVILIVLLKSKNRLLEKKDHILAYAPSIFTIILLLWFCTNLEKAIYKLRLAVQSFIPAVILHPQLFLCIIYVLAVVTVMTGYLFIFFKWSKFIKKQNYYWIAICFLLIISLGSQLWFSQNRLTKNSFSSTQNNQSLLKKPISNVILIVLDTVRADFLSVYNDQNKTKHLVQFSKDSVIFDNCIAPSEWTQPSHASLFTGLYPVQHGMHKYFDGENLWPILPDKFTTLAEIFQDHGYITAGIVSNRWALGPSFNFQQGFQLYDVPFGIGTFYDSYFFKPIMPLVLYLFNILPKYTLFYRPAEDMNKRIFPFVKANHQNPFFLFINYLDAHTPYQPPVPFNPIRFPFFHKVKQWAINYKDQKKNKKVRNSFNKSQYSAEISYLDEHLGRFFVKLKELNLYDSSLIIVTSDHGELLGEHDLIGHMFSPMYEPLLKIPLIIKYPYSRVTGRKKNKIMLTDLYPTILSLCDLPIPDTVSRKAFGDHSQLFVSEYYDKNFGKHRALYCGSYKFMEFTKNKALELYDLKKDPQEKQNIISQVPEVTVKMQRKLREWEKRFKAHKKQETEATDEMLEDLKTLGYIQ